MRTLEVCIFHKTQCFFENSLFFDSHTIHIIEFSPKGKFELHNWNILNTALLHQTIFGQFFLYICLYIQGDLLVIMSPTELKMQPTIHLERKT
jgi:hypothetical protein